MLHVSAEANAVIAQIIAVIVFAAAIELRKAYRAQTIWEMRILTAVLVVVGSLSAGGVLIARIEDTASGGAVIETPLSMTWWILLNFGWPLLVLVAAEGLKRAGQLLSRTTTAESKPMTWAWRELFPPVRRGSATKG